MTEEELALLLDQRVQAVVDGRETPNQYLADDDEELGELQALLQVAAALVQVAPLLDAAKKAKARVEFLAAIRQTDTRPEPAVKDTPPPTSGAYEPQTPRSSLSKLLLMQ